MIIIISFAKLSSICQFPRNWVFCYLSSPVPQPPSTTDSSEGTENKTEWSIAQAGKIELEHIKGRLSSKVFFHRTLSSIEGRLPSKFIFHQRSSSIEDRLPSKVLFHQRSSSIDGRLPSKVVFHQRLSSAPELPPSYSQSESSNMSLVS